MEMHILCYLLALGSGCGWTFSRVEFTMRPHTKVCELALFGVFHQFNSEIFYQRQPQLTCL
jgi:hypothetical protein